MDASSCSAATTLPITTTGTTVPGRGGDACPITYAQAGALPADCDAALTRRPVPFGSLPLHPDLLRGIRELGFVKPTPIQADAIPPALEGRDVLACAMTGSGKTAAFLLPILHRLMTAKRGTTRALVITPTRELAAQVLQELNELAVHTPITAAAIFGGVGMQPQEHAFRSGVDVIVATPGRLLDHLKQPYGRLDHVQYLVLDEADRMLDLGFLPDIRKVLSHVPKKRQTLFFSATMPAPIVALAKEMLHSPAQLNLERTSRPAVGITQAVYPVAQDLKASLLLHLLDRNIMREALVFTRTKHRANRLWEFLDERGIAVGRIHGNRSQAQRTDALDGFKSGKYRVLVATDIAARGIDVEALGHVVNFDVPVSPEDYVHRVGRTARAESSASSPITHPLSPSASSRAFISGRHASTTLVSIQVANPSFSQRSSHHSMVTRLPNQWCAISCATFSAMLRRAATEALCASSSTRSSRNVMSPAFSIAPNPNSGTARRSSFGYGYGRSKYSPRILTCAAAASSASSPSFALPRAVTIRIFTGAEAPSRTSNGPTASARR
ncbi:MAG: DEAD/DEAH box helicase [Gemmatimonadaceae bacterium]|nr:DEAD/DEAH box helicase [Gemmatimonadaceae bacterium]